jgi:hypothetical protein
VQRAIRLPVYRRLLAAYTLNELGWWSASVALSLLVYRHTGSALGAMVFFLCASFVPALIAPVFVARVDQRPVRVVLPWLYLIGAVLVGLDDDDELQRVAAGGAAGGRDRGRRHARGDLHRYVSRSPWPGAAGC